MRRVRRIAFVLLAALAGSSCSVTRHTPDGKYFLQKVNVISDPEIPRRDRIPTDELKRYIKQSPNKRVLGTNLRVNVYNLAKPEKDNRWNRWKRRIGQEPVYFDRTKADNSAEELKLYMDTKGYFSSRVHYEVDTTSRRKRASVTYRTTQGEPYLIDTVSFECRDTFVEQIIMPDISRSLLRAGDRFDIATLKLERNRIASHLKRMGFFDFTINNIEYIADTLAGNRGVKLKMIIKPSSRIDGNSPSGFENNRVYRIKSIYIQPDFDATRSGNSQFKPDTLRYHGLNIITHGEPNLRPNVLRQAVPIYPNYIYNTDEMSRTYTDLMALGYFRSVRISFSSSDATELSSRQVSYVGAADSLLRADNGTKEGYLDCTIHCTPMLKQSFKIDLEGSTASSFYGLKTTVGYQNRNIFRGAESFDMSVTGGFEFMKAPDAERKRALELGATMGVTLPRFLMPWRLTRYRSVNQPKTKIELSVNKQDRLYYDRILSSAGITYMWSNNRYSAFSLTPININVIDVARLDPDFLQVDSDDPDNQGMVQNKYLRESFRTQFVGGLSFSYNYNNQRKNMGGDATNIRFNLETAGNLIDGVKHLFFPSPADGGEYEIFSIPYSQYFRTDLSVSRKIMLGEKSALVGRLYGGVAMAYGNSTAVPFDRQFYSGGSNGMRGWAPRTLGQGSVPDPADDFPIQTGDIKLEANLELRFPIWGMVHGATFFDLGNIWYIKSEGNNPDAVFRFNRFYEQLGFNTGIGLRFDIRYFVLRLDWGIQLHNPNRPAGQRWIHNFKWSNTALNFGVGYPF